VSILRVHRTLESRPPPPRDGAGPRSRDAGRRSIEARGPCSTHCVTACTRHRLPRGDGTGPPGVQLRGVRPRDAPRARLRRSSATGTLQLACLQHATCIIQHATCNKKQHAACIMDAPRARLRRSSAAGAHIRAPTHAHAQAPRRKRSPRTSQQQTTHNRARARATATPRAHTRLHTHAHTHTHARTHIFVAMVAESRPIAIFCLLEQNDASADPDCALLFCQVACSC
jgi:hypothetical protein